MPSQDNNQKSTRMTAKEWMLIDKDIIEWYSVQRRSLSQMQKDAWEKYKFIATDRQWKHHLKMLKCKKNIRKDEMKHLIRIRQQQRLNRTNPSNVAFRLGSVTVDSKKIDRHIRELEKEQSDLSPNTAIPSGQQWDLIIPPGSTMPSTRDVPDFRTEQSLKTPGNPLRLTTVNILWALDVPWYELLNGHQADPCGFPLGALAMVLRDRAAELDIFLGPELTLTDVLRELFTKTLRILWSNIGFTKDAVKSDAGWQIKSERRTIDDSLYTINLTVCCQEFWEQISVREKSYVSIYLRLAHSGRLLEGCTATYCTWKGNMSAQPIFDVIRSDKDDTVKVVEVERILNEDSSALLYFDQTSEMFPLEITAENGNLATTRLLLDRGSPIRSHLRFMSVIRSIWFGLARRCQEKSPCMPFEEDFARCVDMTSLAVNHGAQIHEDIHYNEIEGSVLWVVNSITTLQPHQLGNILKYLLSFGLDIEHRSQVGMTPFLYAIERGGHSAVSAFLDAGADLYAENILGKGYLQIVLTGLVQHRPLKHSLKEKRATIRKKLEVLLKIDRRFRERPIKPEETPFITRLALNEQDWNLWMSVFKHLGWNTTEMEVHRYKTLLRHRWVGIGNENQRCRLLEQVRSRIGKIKAKEISSSLTVGKNSESDGSEESDESDCSDEV